jgi:hypothetical protein
MDSSGPQLTGSTALRPDVARSRQSTRINQCSRDGRGERGANGARGAADDDDGGDDKQNINILTSLLSKT